MNQLKLFQFQLANIQASIGRRIIEVNVIRNAGRLGHNVEELMNPIEFSRNQSSNAKSRGGGESADQRGLQSAAEHRAPVNRPLTAPNPSSATSVTTMETFNALCASAMVR